MVNIISRLNNLVTRSIKHDFDNYQDALWNYAYTQCRAGSNAVGFEEKYGDLKQFFARTKKSKGEDKA